MAEMEDECLSERENCEQESTLDMSNDKHSSGLTEDRIRVDRRKLEILLQAGIKDGQESSDGGEEFFKKIQTATNTVISWPSRLKIGAKSKKDPHIKVAGLPTDVKKAREMILSVLDVKNSRVTLKMDVSFTDHSHIIGRGGNCIKRVMQETGCHIHFPDSNRTSSDKSNQVSIAGPPHGVEAARRQIRELLPIVLMFEIPQKTIIAPDSTSPAIHSIAQKYNVTITFKQRPRSYGFLGIVRGLHSDPVSVRDAVLRVLEHLTGSIPVTYLVTTQIEIDCKHHTFIIGRNGSNIKQIMQNTGASLQFPDQNGTTQGKKSTVYITGPIESTICAKVQLMEFLPLVLMFDVKEGEDELVSDARLINRLIEDLDVLINVKSKPRQGNKFFGWLHLAWNAPMIKVSGSAEKFFSPEEPGEEPGGSVIVKGIEKNAYNMYLTRSHLVREDLSLVPLISAPLPTPPMKISNPFICPPHMGMPMPGSEFPTALLTAGINRKFVPNAMSAGTNEVITSSPIESPLPQCSTSPLSYRQPNSSPRTIGNPAITSYETVSSTNPQTSDMHPNSTSERLASDDLVRTLSVDSLFKRDDPVDHTDVIKESHSTGHINANAVVSNLHSDRIPSSLRGDGLARSGDNEQLSALRQPNSGSYSDVLLPMAVGARVSPTNGQDSPHQIALSSGSWNAPQETIAMLGGVRNIPFSSSDVVSSDPVLSDSQSELNMSGSLSKTSNLIERLPFRNKKYNIADYEHKRQMASRAITNETDYEEVRMPTGTWSGFGFSKSMPESTLKDLWMKTSRAPMNKYSLVDSFQHSPSQSLNSSASSNMSSNSNSSSSSASYSGSEGNSRRLPSRAPPPGLEGKPSLENAALLLNNNIDFSSVIANDSSLGTLAAVTDLCDLFSRLGLAKYSEVFQDQEVDLNTFMTLTDDDLKELGVSTFGARRRMILAIQDLKKIHGERDLSGTSSTTRGSSMSPAIGQRSIPLDLASSSLRW